MPRKFTIQIIDSLTPELKKYIKPYYLIIYNDVSLGTPLQNHKDAMVICDWLNTVELDESDNTEE